MTLDAEQMKDVGACIAQAFEHQLKNTFGQTKLDAMAFVYDVVLRQKPFMMVTQQGYEAIVASVFQKDDIRDFVLSMTYNFYTYWASSTDDHESLAKTLALAAGYQVPSLIPKQITDYLATVEAAEKILVNNRWLCMLMLLPVWLEAPDPEAEKKAK